MADTTTHSEEKKAAVLIDAENVSPDLADQIFTSAATCGIIVVREIYGTATALTSWIQPVLKYAIHSNLTVKASKGKNSSDISLVIGAMDLLRYQKISTIIIVSSDSDFSSLSVRLRADGIHVVGMGAEKANPLWRTSCSSFIVLNEKKIAQTAAASSSRPVAARPAVAAKPVVQPVRPAVTPKPASQPIHPAALVKPATASQPAAQTAAAAPAVTVAKIPTHEERLTHIREHIAELLKAEGGSMPVTRLFQDLNRFHEYQVDQAGSKRKPLNYLTWAFGKNFYFIKTPNGTVVSLEPATPAQNEAVEPTDVPSAMAEGEAVSPIPEAASEPADVSSVAAEVETAAPNPEESVTPEPDSEETPAPAASKPEKTAEINSAAETTPAASENQESASDQPSPKTKSTRKKAAGSRRPRAKTAEPDPGLALIVDMKEIPARIRKALIATGRATLRDAAQVSDEELKAIPQVGVATISAFRKAVTQLLGE